MFWFPSTCTLDGLDLDLACADLKLNARVDLDLILPNYIMYWPTKLSISARPPAYLSPGMPGVSLFPSLSVIVLYHTEESLRQEKHSNTLPGETDNVRRAKVDHELIDAIAVPKSIMS
jgi:hypothetical protein